MAAVEADKLECVKWLLDAGADPNQQMSTGWSAMHAAAKKKNAKIMAELLQVNYN